MEELKKYREKIENLTEEEKKLRDKEYIMPLAKGEIQGPKTGYPSIDKPWLVQYKKEDLDYELPSCSIYEYMYNDCQKYKNNIMMEIGHGKKAIKITYAQGFKIIDKIARALKQMNVQKGDIVSICMPNTPEVGFIFWAVNKIGAIANMLDPRTNSENLESSINDANSKLLITLDRFNPIFDKIVDNTKIQNVVSVSPIASLPTLIRKIVCMKDKTIETKLPKNKKFVDYQTFINNGKKYKKDTLEKIDCNNPAVIAYTGGTSGQSKGVIASHKCMTSMIVENRVMGYDVEKGDRCLNIAPPWTYYGLSNCLNAYAHLGATSIMVPEFDPNNLGQLVLDYLPNHIITVPSTLISIMNNKELNNMDLSFIKTIIVGADKMDPKLETEFNEWLAKHNSKCKITKGYGMTEVTAAATYTKENANVKGSVGVPYIAENVSVFDPETGKELRVGATGELAIKGPKIMKGYFGINKDKTNEVLKKHEDGTTWAHTADLGHIDEEGIVYVDGRLKRMFTKAGFKIFAPEIENNIYKHNAVLQCAVVPVPSEEFGCQAKAFIVLKDSEKENQEKIQNEIIEILKEKVFDYEIPDFYEFRDSLPLTGMNKINYKELEREEIEKYNSHKIVK